MKNRYVYIFIFLSLFVIFGYLYVDSMVQKGILISEIDKIYDVDTTTLYTPNIRTHFVISKVEKSIKKYLMEQSKDYNDVGLIMSGNDVKMILSYNNYKNDFPSFDNSLITINGSKNKVNKKMKKLINESNIDYVINLEGDKYKTIFSYYFDNSDMRSYLDSNKNKYSAKLDEYNNILNTEIEIINFLKNNKDNYELNDGEVQFKNDELFNQYSSLVNKLK